MKRYSGLVIASCVVFGLLLYCAQASPANETSTGGITGTVMKDGKPVIGVKVKLAPAHAKGQKKSTGPATKPSESNAKPAKVPPIASATTDADGKFVMSDIAAGDYVVSASEKGIGRGKAKVTVAAGQSTDVSVDLQQAPPKDKAGKKNKLGL